MTLEEIFHQKINENGDLSYTAASLNNLVNIFFMTEYFSKHLDEVNIGTSFKEQLFARLIRDPRFGLGLRDLGRKLMFLSEVNPEDIVASGRFDDLFFAWNPSEALDFWKAEIEKGNELAKKWAPRYSSKNLLMARELAKLWGMNKQQYGHFIKVETTESNLSRKTTDKIVFEHVPSKAMIKYTPRFKNGADTAERYAEYIESVKKGEKKLNVSTTTPYDIYTNREKIDADVFFEQLKKIQINCIPIIDTSLSMRDENDSYGKAVAIGHYLAKCSTYAPNKVIAFSAFPKLIDLGKARPAVDTQGRDSRGVSGGRIAAFTPSEALSNYENEIKSLYTGDCSNTDFRAVLGLLSQLDSFPEYLVVLSDMEFDGPLAHRQRIYRDINEFEEILREHGANTKLVWWNFNSRNTTAPEMDSHGNIFMSGYNPALLRFLDGGLNAETFIDKLLVEYFKHLQS